jgi:dTDP-4-amino-4,6-dideoxygalactose transaminase
MIGLFSVNNYNIDTSKFSNLLHDKIINEFEQSFAKYVGAKYACSANSASSLLFLALSKLNTTISIPSTIPPVVPNVIINSGNKIEFYDDVEWVGKSYRLYENIIDSAQEVTRNQYKNHGDPLAQMIFSFYPTKPVGSCDGGIVVSDDKDTIDWYRMMTLNGMHFSENNWDRKHVAAGYKMHATSIQAYLANENLKKLDKKNKRLDEISVVYNTAFGYNNTSRHLYRVRVNNNKKFIEEMKRCGIVCGIHYEHCHNKSFYNWDGDLPTSEKESIKTVSLPFHENLTDQDIEEVIKHTKRLATGEQE